MRHLRELPFSEYVKDAFQKTRHVRMPVNDIGTIDPGSQRADFTPGRNTWYTSPVVGFYEKIDLTGPFSGFKVPLKGWDGITTNMVFFKLLELYGFTHEIGKIHPGNDTPLQSTDTILTIPTNGYYTGTVPIKFTSWVANPTFQDFLDSCSLFLPVVDWMESVEDSYASVAYRLTGTDEQILDALSEIVSFYGSYNLKPTNGIGTQWEELEDILHNSRDNIRFKKDNPDGRGRCKITLYIDVSSRPSYIPYQVSFYVYRYPLKMTQFFSASAQAMVGANVRLSTIDEGKTLFELLSTCIAASSGTTEDVGWYPDIVSMFTDYSDATGERGPDNVSNDIPSWSRVSSKRGGVKSLLTCGLPIMPVSGIFVDGKSQQWLMVGNSADNLDDAWMFGVGYSSNILSLGAVLTSEGKLPTDITEVTKNIDMQIAGNIAILANVLQGWGTLTPNNLIYENLGSYWKITSSNQQCTNVFLTATKK